VEGWRIWGEWGGWSGRGEGGGSREKMLWKERERGENDVEGGGERRMLRAGRR